MVAQWDAAVTMFNQLTPHLHDCTSCWRRASHWAASHGKPGRIVIISAIEAVNQWSNNDKVHSSKLWGRAIFHRVIMVAAHTLKTSGMWIDKSSRAQGMMVTMGSHDYTMLMVSYILSVEPQSEWMWTETPTVHGNNDLRWILRFLDSSSGLTLQLPPHTVSNTLNFDDRWVSDGSNVSGTKRGAGFTAVLAPSKKGPKFGLLVDCTTLVLDVYMLPIICEVGKLGGPRKHRTRWSDGTAMRNQPANKHCGFMHGNDTAITGEPYSVQEPKTNHQHPAYACNYQTCFTHVVLWSWPVLHPFDRWYLSEAQRDNHRRYLWERLPLLARLSLFALVGGVFGIYLDAIFLALHRWIPEYLRWNDCGDYFPRLLTRAGWTWSCWGQGFLSWWTISQGRWTEYLCLRESRVWHVIWLRLCCA